MTKPIINTPELWQRAWPRPDADTHKYQRGHAVILGAPVLTGATRLAAEACSRIGAGLVTVLGGQAADVYRKTLPADIMVPDDQLSELKGVTAVLAGPGGMHSREYEAFLESTVSFPVVLDAGAILEGKETPAGRTRVLTPHQGEFSRAFPQLKNGREDNVIDAAKSTGAYIVLKGAETLIASPDGKLALNTHASPWLAKAGTGDVLAGLITGLVAQGMEPFLAACAAVWIHGEAGARIGAGLVASDLPNLVPEILKDLLLT